MKSIRLAAIFMATGLGITACGDDEAGETAEAQEVITTVALSFVPAAGGSPIVAEFDDADGEGGNAPTIDTINLTAGTSYNLFVSFANKLEDPVEDVTEEIQDESDEHQIFFTGTGVMGPASDASGAVVTHSYSDADINGYPVGIANSIVANTAGTGTFIVTLRHLPPVNESAVKTGDLATDALASGISSLPGENDVNVTFDLTVQ